MNKKEKIRSWERIEGECPKEECDGKMKYSLRNFTSRCMSCDYIKWPDLKSPR